MTEIKRGDRVYVTDPGLAELRHILRSAGYLPLPNHVGTVEDPDWGNHGQVMVVFDDEDGPGMGSAAPYLAGQVRRLPEPDSPEYRPWPWQQNNADQGGNG